MPWEWDIPLEGPPAEDAPGMADGGPPIARLHAWPFRSLPRRGFVFVIGFAFAALMVPLTAFIGTLMLWWILAPGLAALGGLWWFLDRSYRDGEILEELTIWPDRIRLTRTGPHGAEASWEANPHWVTVQRHRTGGPVPDYVTLKGGGREVEIGAFLSAAERPALFEALEVALVKAKSRRPPTG